MNLYKRVYINVFDFFTKKYINLLNDEDLFCLSKLLDIDDENLFKFIKGQNTTVMIKLLEQIYWIRG